MGRHGLHSCLLVLLVLACGALALPPLCSCIASEESDACATAISDTCDAAPTSAVCVGCSANATSTACVLALHNATDEGNDCVDWSAWCECAAQGSCIGLLNSTCAIPGRYPPPLVLPCQVCPMGPDSQLCTVLIRDLLIEGFEGGSCSFQHIQPFETDLTCPSSLSDQRYEQLQLGRAFGAYKDGTLEVPLVYEEHLSLIGDEVGQIPFDCTEFQQTADNSSTAIWLNVLFVVYVVIGTFVFVLRRNRQPIKARSLTVSLSHIVLLLMSHVMISVRFMYGLTAPCLMVLLQSFLGTPLIVLTYTWRAMQLAFLYHWAQNKSDPKKRSWYRHKRRFVRNRSFFLTQLVGLVVGVLFVVVFWVSTPELGSLSSSTYQTLRCGWWQIPEEYQPELEEDVYWCDCIEGNQTMCDLALVHECANGAITEVVDLCTACISSNASSLTEESTDCDVEANSYMNQINDNGDCGRASETPSFKSCQSCLGHHSGLIISGGYNCALLLVALGVCLRVRHLDDQVWIRGELLGFQFIALPAMAITQALYLNDRFSREISGSIVDQPHFWIIVSLMWISFTLSFAVPVVMSFRLRIRRRMRWVCGVTLGHLIRLCPCLERVGGGYLPKTRDKMLMRGRLTHLIDDRHSLNASGSSSSVFPSISESLKSRDARDAFSSMARSGAGSHMPATPTLSYVLNSPEALDLYREFAKKEFTIENVEFLMGVRELLLSESAAEARAQALFLWATFVSVESDLEVNLPAQMHDELADVLDGHPDALDSLSRQQVCGLFADACLEIEQLVERDSFERFRDSEGYDQVLEMYGKDTQFERAIGARGVVVAHA